MSQLIEIDAKELSINPFTSLDKEWALFTAGDPHNWNTMTVSWGGLGVIWNKYVTTAYIRPQRYTFEFIEKSDIYTLSFFDSEYKSALSFCGSKSGRDYDKVTETGLTPILSENGVYFEEAKLVLQCKKLHSQFIDPKGFIDPAIENNYAQKDYHKLYIGEIVKAFIKE